MREGFINLLKPPGPTSHDMVAFVRRLIGIKRVGHTGTLDPLAAGVLVIAIGRATRLIPYLTTTKIYRGEITFGKATDTLDSAGNITLNTPAKIGSQHLKDILPRFTGTISQTPPMVSALKWRGQRLYDLARKGVEIERNPREITIDRLELLSFYPDLRYPRALIECHCSSGTYIRSLAADIGETIGCGSYLSFLLRTLNGIFSIENSLTPHEFELAVANGSTGQWLLPPNKGVSHLPQVILTASDERKFLNGNMILLKNDDNGLVGSVYCIHNADNNFLGLGKLELFNQGFNLKPVVVFN